MHRPVINPTIADYMMSASRSLFEAVQSGDVDLAIAVLRKMKGSLDLCISVLEEGKQNGNDYR